MVYGDEQQGVINGLLLAVSALVGIISLTVADLSQVRITTNFPRKISLLLTRHVI